MITLQSKIKDIYSTPVGHDILYKILLQMGKKESLLTNPLVANMKLKTVAKLTKKSLGEGFFQTFVQLLNSEQDVPDAARGDVSHKWWKEAVFYQIYPRTFSDSNGDGIGDLKGICSKLDYLKNLGVDALWLSPVYDSPNDDNGYDIRDYHKIMKEFGTMEDFDLLLEETHKKGMKLIMDLVVNHTSDEHEWFKSALADKNSKYRDYYFFRDGGKEAPNNWTSFFSGPAWNYYPKEDTWALHLFSKKQMDLNHDNPDVRKEVVDIVNWWLDKGVDGFRMDVINYISKAPGLPQGDASVGQLMEFTGIEHYFYGPRLHEYLREYREKAFEPHNAFSVGETPGLGMKMCQLVTGEGRGELDMVFSFDHLETPGHVRFDDYRYDLNYLKDYMNDWQLNYGNRCWMSLFYNNHDNPKMISKVNPEPSVSVKLAKLLATIQFTLKGTPFVFQGDEMGLINHEFKSIDEITDVESKGLYKKLTRTMTPEEAFKVILAGTREHSRLPMPWEEAEKHREVTDFYKEIIGLRRSNPAFIYGDYKLLSGKKDEWMYERTLGDDTFVVECNLSDKNKSREADLSKYQSVISPNKNLNPKIMAPYEAVVLRQSKTQKQNKLCTL